MAVSRTSERALAKLVGEIRRCQACAGHLPFGPRPVLQVAATARLLICGQAPGTKVHATGLPFNDPSGDRLRKWMGVDRATFYDSRRVAIVPMGFCYPGRDVRGGDKPPRSECAPLWRPRLLPLLERVELTLLVGSYAQAWYLGDRRKRDLTATVRAWREFLPDYLPLPHPSWRNTGWLRRHPWFENEVVPYLQREVRRLVRLGSGG